MLEVVNVLCCRGALFRNPYLRGGTMLLLSHTVRFCSRILEVALFFAAAAALAVGAATTL